MEFPAARVLRPGGTALVLLAGQAKNHRWWDGARDDFHVVRNALTLDSRGTGESEKPNKPYGNELFALDVVAVLDYLGVHRAEVDGTSTGGRLARQLAARHPHLVRALGPGCASPGGPHGIERDSVVSRSLVQARPGAARQALLGLTYTPAWLATEAGRRHPRSAPGQQESPGGWPGALAWGG
ncbi:alpha/beta fold hydrolase [Streptomyces rubiginosohelvolus]|uniref:alpha/beta fold hydrolase n=1 Tax=Streptomyces rubiginosohelvolus TaxID=67362 RepID=UPI0035DE6426